MANVKVAIRVRPLNSREDAGGGRLIVQVEDKVVRVRNIKLDGRLDGRVEAPGDSRERVLEFGFDYCYWSVNPEAPNYASQEEVFQDLGMSVLAGAAEGYNVCLFAYGQTGSGKTYTMMGTPDSYGLTPRICQGLFQSDMDSHDGRNCRVEVSFLEIYNERVRDLLRGADQKKPATLRVREHPEKGPYVQGLSQHVVEDYKQAADLLEVGIANRITAATHNHDASSRSHAIFSIQYTQAILENNLPSEIVSKINLVDLAGSERADSNYCRDRITEGANINKSLVALGIVISALAQNSQMSSSSQSINSMVSEGEVSTVGSQFSSLSNSSRKHCFIPYRDSVLTWLLKDSLGGNSKTIMIATISPSCSSYNETLSTLRYAAHAKNIVNKPRVNEDANVRLIRELREEIDRLKSMLQNFSMRNPSPSLSDERDSSISDIVLQNELKVEQLTKDWSESWWDKRSMLEQYNVDINQDRAGVQIHSLMPHLISLEPDVLSTGVTIYHLWEGVTGIGAQNGNEKDSHAESFLPEGSLCEIENRNGVVTLRPLPHIVCMVNGREVTEPCRLAQGAVITLGGRHKFRFNHPAEAAVLRERRRVFVEGGQLCSSSEFKPITTSSRVAEIGGEEPIRQIAPRQKLEEHQRYVECLRQEIQVEQRRDEKDLEREQACLQQQRSEIQQWILQEKQRLTIIRGKGTLDSGVQTDLVPLPALTDLNQKPLNECDCVTVSPSLIVGDRKRVVQEELLKHHALRRNENHVRRKRLHYQLQRIARKRHLLEAKQELRRLENNLPAGADESSSPEIRSPSKRRGRPVALRRHSFSVDLLSRLYPQHTPIFSQFLRRNRSTEFTSSFCTITAPRKWVSDEDLPERTRARSNTMPSIGGQRSSVYSSENIRMLPTEDTTDELTDRKVLNSQLESSVWNNHDEDQNISPTSTVDSNRDTKRVLPIIKQMRTQKSSTKGGKSLTLEGSKGLETFRKALSRSVGSGIRTALSRVFRKPPLGSRSGKGAKSAGKAKAQFVAKDNKDKTLGSMQKREPMCIRPAMSCDGLDDLKSLKDKKQGCWHSAETLNSKNSRWVKVQQEQTDWVENNGEEETDGSSDCDSLFSVDSLSSAYANALAEQLRQENHEPSEAESADSQMSKDSLAQDRSGISITAKPSLKLSHSVCHSFLPKSNLQTTMHGVKSKDVPAEIFWRIHGNKVAKEFSQTLQVSAETRPSSDASVRETDHLLTLTDAWSSNDATDSPQNPKASEDLLKQELYTPAENHSRQCLSSLDLSGEIYESEPQTLPYFESTESGGATVKEQSHKSSEREANLDYFSSNPTSTSCSTPENTTLQESKGLLSNCEPQYTSGESSSTQDMTNNHTPSTNKPIPLKTMPVETTDDDLLLINSHSNRSNVMQDGSSPECLPGKSHAKDLQNRFTDQAAFVATGVETDVIAIQKDFTESKEATMSKENFVFLLGCDPSKDVITVSKCGHNTPPESRQSDETLQPESVLKNSNIQQPHQPAMCSLKRENFLHESQSNTELFIQAASDGKALVQNQEVSHDTGSHETRNGKDHLLKMNTSLESSCEVTDCVPLEYESCSAQYKHSRKRSKDSQDVSNCNMKIPKIGCTEAVARCDPAVANVVFKFNATSGNSRVATEKSLATETESMNSYSGYKKRMCEQESKLVSVDNSKYRPELTGTKQQKIAKHLMNETEIVDGRECVCSKPQKMCHVINEQISEVVKDHLNMLVGGEDFIRNQETENKKSSALNAEDLKNIQHKYEMTSANIEHSTQSHPDTIPCKTNSGTSDNVTDQKCFFEGSSTERLGTDFITNCSPRPVQNVSVEIWVSDGHDAYGPVANTASGQDLNVNSTESSTVLCVGSADNDSFKTEHFNVLISEVNVDSKIPTQPTSVSTYLQCEEIISNPEFTTSAHDSNCEKSDQFVIIQSDMLPMNKACHDPTSTGTSVRIKEAGFDLPSCNQGQPGPRPETTSISGKTKENSDVQVSNQWSEAAVDCIISDMHKEAAMCKSVEESKVNMTVEFQQGVNTMAHTDAESEIQRNECLLNSNISCNGAASCHATDSGLQTLAHPECALGYPAEEQFFSRDHGELNTSDRNDKSMELGNHILSVNRNKTITISKSWQHRAESSTPSELQGDNQVENTQTVITCRKTFSCPRPDQSSGKEINNDCRSKVQAQYGYVRTENQLQFQESSMLTESVKIPDHDRRWANKREAKNVDTSTKTESLKVKPKDHHKVKIETAAKANGGEETRMSFSKPNDDTMRLKPKRYRRAHFTAPSSSSTDSTPDSSLDKIAKTRVHKYTVASSVKNCSPAIEGPNVVSENINIADDLSMPPSSAINPRRVESRLEDHQSLGSGTGPYLAYAGATRDVTTVVEEDARCQQQRQNHLTSEPLQVGMSVDDEAVHLAMDNSSKRTSLENKHEVHKESDSTQNREPVIHFTSSDINPFVHARKSDRLLKPMNTNQSFGSAVAISRQLSPPEYSDKVITRCCSVDNGLNVQNSPFDSHLSMYAIQKGLSSTLSSTEDSKEHIFEAPQLNKVFDIPFVCKEKSSVSSSSGSNSATLESGHSSGQVDEIVLVCASERESQKNRQDSRSCDHSTQTVRFEDLKQNSRHRRSSTQVPVSKQAHGKPTTWSSLQNMSEHLSELIVSTSDLLGNIQCMRTGERPRRYGHSIQNNSKVCADKLEKSDGSTQTAIDIGIQTEDSLLFMKQNKVLQNSPPMDDAKPQEVNVIVKVIGPEICSMPKEGGVFKNECDSRQSFDNIKSMPDLHPRGPSPSKQFGRKLDDLKFLSLDTVVPNQNYLTARVVTPDTVDYIASNPSSNQRGTRTSEKLTNENDRRQNPKTKTSLDKQVPHGLLVDRASSPILTVEVPRSSQKGIKTSAQHLSNHKSSKMDTETRISRTVRNPHKNTTVNSHSHRVCGNKPGYSMSLENLSFKSFTNPYGSDTSSTEISISNRCTQNDIKKLVCEVQNKGASQAILCNPPSQSQSSALKHWQHDDRPTTSQSCGISMPVCKPSNDLMACWSDTSKNSPQYQDMDIMSLAPSECNTDILVSINPLNESTPLPEDLWIPHDLPMHNKFTNWSGINQEPLARRINEKTAIAEKSLDLNANSLQNHSYIVGYKHKSDSERTDRRTREIERLRMEREQVLSSMHLDPSPHPLSVELMEARLHYGLGQTDTLLKMLKSSNREESTISTKQQLNDRHRRSIDGWRKEREACLQPPRRARSLSPSRHTNSSQRALDLPSRQREYLQQLRKEVVEMTRAPDPPRREGQCPTDIELLLRDYSRAREEAKMEIAKARVRLRERTEQEKRRLQQQALTQAVKDDLRHRTRVSNSTLCTGSNLSLSSGPTSGYNSSNAALLKDATSPSTQITGVSDVGLRVKTRPPVIPSQGLKTSRAWLSVQDIRLENSGYELQSSSSPSSPPARQRTCSFGSPSAISISYQDIADCTITSAMSEVHLASGGDIRNLLTGKAKAGWRHQGLERGVQTYHRPSPRPSAHGFLGAMELDRSLTSLRSVIRDHSKIHLYHQSLKSAWTQSLDERTQLVYLLTDPSNCQLKQPRDFCCLSAESRQDDMWVLAMQSVFEESLPRPSVNTVRGEMFPSAWILQPSQRQGQDVVLVVYLLQVDLGTPSLPQRLLNGVARKQAAIIADLDSFLSL